MIRILFSILLISLFSCQAQVGNYDLTKPSKRWVLPKILNEVSGLEMLNDSTVLCIQDEIGTIFFFDIVSKQIRHQLEFKNKGDFEGITQANGAYFVLESHGDLYKVAASGAKEKFSFHKKGVEFEGLCFDKKNKQLLLACKQHEGNNKFIKLYAFDLQSKKFSEKPILKLKKEKVHENFKPSGLAFGPKGNLYIISSVAKNILVLNEKLELLEQTQINPFVFHQPEGICFNSLGDMFVSNEKNEGSPNILKFVYDKK